MLDDSFYLAIHQSRAFAEGHIERPRFSYPSLSLTVVGRGSAIVHRNTVRTMLEAIQFLRKRTIR